MGRNSNSTTSVEFALPESLLEKLENECNSDRYENSSEFLKQAIRNEIERSSGGDEKGELELEEGDREIFKRSLDTIPDLFYIFDEDGNFIKWNQRFSEVSGYNDDEIMSMHPLEFIPEEDKEAIAEDIIDIFEKDIQVTNESKLVTKSGDEIPYEFNGSLLTDEEEEVIGLVGVSRDISKRKEMEKEIRENRRKLSTLISNLPGIAYRCKNEPDWPMSFVSEGCYDLTGYHSEEVENDDVRWGSDIIHPDDQEQVWNEVQEALDKHVNFEITYRILTQDDEVKWVWEQGRGIYQNGDLEAIEGFITDITKRKKTRQELREERDKFTSLVNEVKNYAIFMLDPKGNIVSWNEGAKNIKGYEKNEIIGEHFSVFYTDEDIERGVPEENLSKAEDERVQDEGWRVRKDGSRFWANVTITPLYEDGRLRGYAKITRDMTDQREYIKKIENQKEELERLNRINQEIRKINQRLVDCDTRDEIEREVVEISEEMEPYLFAWIGRHDLSKQEVVPSVKSKSAKDYVDRITVKSDESGKVLGPGGKAASTGEVQVVQNILENDAFKPYQDLIEEFGYRSVASIPLKYGDLTYGILNVYSELPYAFDTKEREVLEELGKTIGLAINSIERKNALVSNTETEIKLRIPDDSPDLRDFSDVNKEKINIKFDGSVKVDEDRYLHYLHIKGMSPETAERLLNELPHVVDTRMIQETKNELWYQLDTSSPPLLSSLSEYGGRLKDLRIEKTGFKVVIELPRTTDLRKISEIIKDAYPDAEFLAQRTTDKKVRGYQIRKDIDDALTEKQRAALETAYFSGYFDWPRTTSAEGVSDSLEISNSTFQQHLRYGLSKVMSRLLD